MDPFHSLDNLKNQFDSIAFFRNSVPSCVVLGNGGGVQHPFLGTPADGIPPSVEYVCCVWFCFAKGA